VFSSPRSRPAGAGRKTMLHKLPKIVLVLIVLMVVFSPFMQLDSWDDFPAATGDIELQIVAILFETGMFFVFAGILYLLPVLLRTGVVPSLVFAGASQDDAAPETSLFSFTPPLRI
jgi:hypothetical protein